MKLFIVLTLCFYSIISQADIYKSEKFYLNNNGSNKINDIITKDEAVYMQCKSLIRDYFYFSSPFEVSLVKNIKTNSFTVFFNYSERRSTTNGQFGQIGLPVLSQPTAKVPNSTSGGLNRFYGSSEILDIFALEELRISEYTEEQKMNRKGDLYKVVKYDKLSSDPLEVCVDDKKCLEIKNPKVRSNVFKVWCN